MWDSGKALVRDSEWGGFPVISCGEGEVVECKVPSEVRVMAEF